MKILYENEKLMNKHDAIVKIINAKLSNMSEAEKDLIDIKDLYYEISQQMELDEMDAAVIEPNQIENPNEW